MPLKSMCHGRQSAPFLAWLEAVIELPFATKRRKTHKPPTVRKQNITYISALYKGMIRQIAHTSPLISALVGWFLGKSQRGNWREVLNRLGRPQSCGNPRTQRCSTQSNGRSVSARSVFTLRADACRPCRQKSRRSALPGRLPATVTGRSGSLFHSRSRRRRSVPRSPPTLGYGDDLARLLLSPLPL